MLLSHLHWKSEVACCLSFDLSGWLASTPSFLRLYHSIPSVLDRDSVCNLATISGIEFVRLFCFKFWIVIFSVLITSTTHLSAPTAVKLRGGSSMIFIVAFLWWLSLAACCCFQWTLLHGSWALFLALWSSTVFAQLELHLGRIWQMHGIWALEMLDFIDFMGETHWKYWDRSHQSSIHAASFSYPRWPSSSWWGADPHSLVDAWRPGKPWNNDGKIGWFLTVGVLWVGSWGIFLCKRDMMMFVLDDGY